MLRPIEQVIWRDRIGGVGIWPAQHDWLGRYVVFERAAYALKEFVADRKSSNFNSL